MPKSSANKHGHVSLSTVHKKSGPAVTVADCVVAYGDNVVIEGVSFEIERGQIAALIGPNGSGKTTMMRAILELVPLRRGEIRLFGKKLREVRDKISYVPQRFDFDHDFPITVEEFLDLGRRTAPRSRIAEKIAEVGLEPGILQTRLGHLSGGQLQRVLIAQAIMGDPEILFLDEPSSGVDIAGEATFYEIIEHLNREHGTTIVLVSHDIAVVSALVDQVICINKTLLCYGPPRKALTERKLSELFGHGVGYFEHEGHGHDTDAGGHKHKH